MSRLALLYYESVTLDPMTIKKTLVAKMVSLNRESIVNLQESDGDKNFYASSAIVIPKKE